MSSAAPTTTTAPSAETAAALAKGGLHMPAATWDVCAEKYDVSAPMITRPHARWALEKVLEAAGDKKGLAVCDIACGSGVLSLAAAARTDRVASVLASDYSAGMCAVLDKKVAALQTAVSNGTAAPHAPVVTLVSDAQDLSSIPSDSLDACFCIFAIMMVPDPVKATREIVRITKPGGLVAFATWAPQVSQFHQVMGNVMKHIAGKKAEQAKAEAAASGAQAPTSTSTSAPAPASGDAPKPIGAAVMAQIPFQSVAQFESLFTDVSLQPVLLTRHNELTDVYANADEYWYHVQGSSPNFGHLAGEQQAKWAKEWIAQTWGAECSFQLTSTAVIAIGRKPVA